MEPTMYHSNINPWGFNVEQVTPASGPLSVNMENVLSSPSKLIEEWV